MIPISAIVLTKNEQRNIERCLASLAWVPEVVVLDSLSSDSTVSLAQRFSNVRVVSHEWLGFARSKQLAMTHAVHPWILWIDADEEVSSSLREEVERLFSGGSPSPHSAFRMRRKTFFLEKWVAHSGWYPDWVLRLFHRQTGSFDDRLVHEGVELAPGTTVKGLTGHINHYSYHSLDQYFQKSVLYGRLGGEELFRKGKCASWVDLGLRPLWSFVKTYFVRGGVLDGRTGLVVAMGSAFSTFIKYSTLAYLRDERPK